MGEVYIVSRGIFGVETGSPIVTDGLVLHLDAGNPESYPGSGTTWFDLSGNNYHGILNNYGDTPSFSSVAGGTFDFNGNKRFYIDIPLLNNTNSYSVIWFGADGDGDQFGGVSRDTNWQFGNHLAGWQTLAVNTDSGTRPTTGNTVGSNFMIASLNNTSSKVVSHYNNAVLSGTLSYSSWSSRNRWTFGTRGDGEGHQYLGKIGVVLLYNRLLSQQEITQNFNALRNRFGL